MNHTLRLSCEELAKSSHATLLICVARKFRRIWEAFAFSSGNENQKLMMGIHEASDRITKGQDEHKSKDTGRLASCCT